MDYKRKLTMYHAASKTGVIDYHNSGCIKSPVRGFTTFEAAMAWACKTKRTIILKVEGYDVHKLPDHHNKWGDAYWNDGDIKKWKCVFSEKDA